MYAAAVGHNNTAGLQHLAPQPRSTRLIPGRVIAAANGLVYEDGGYTARLVYDALTWAQYTALLAQLGLTNTKSALVTLRLRRDSDNAFAPYNATVTRPTFDENAEASLGILLDVAFEVTRATAI
jgi:hypothetical protein